MNDRTAAGAALPKWLADLDRLLPIRSQFVLSGNIRDTFLVDADGATTLAPVLRALWLRLKVRSYALMVVYDRTDGISVYPKDPALRQQACALLALKLKDDGTMAANLEGLYEVLKTAAAVREARVAVVIDFASRLVNSPQQLDENQQRFFVGCEKLSLHAAPVVPKAAGAAARGEPLFNPIIWLVNRAQDLPSWFVLDSERISTHVIPRPDYQTRLAAAQLLAPLLDGFDAANPAPTAEYMRAFADLTDGMTLSAMGDIVQLATQGRMRLADIDDAVRCYKVGTLDNPWKKDYLRDRIRGAMETIEDRVKGQAQAATKTVDILMRSVTGLTGAQARSSSGRPRGVLFFAGPTGVGKTELAKTLTRIIFGDERAYTRFDMSEFAEEHASARLLGAPPGYVGYDVGGELTNAVREKPFSVILFDEIEKAHPRILDKFLQILEDGRLTDGRGETVYFSEAIIIFTSNLGIYVEGPDGRRIQNVKPGESYQSVERNVREAISNHFRYQLSRPEILNRIGENIVVFNFIVPEVGAKILDGMLDNVVRRVADEHGLALRLGERARAKLRERCLNDLSLGGRGIGNQLETALINPLARAMFGAALAGRTEIEVADITECDNVCTVELGMKILVNKAHFPVTALGPGQRIGIWTQGCTVRCRGCISRDTWEADPGRGIEVDEVLRWCIEVSNGRCDGVTISGGEPFDQPQALGALLDGLRTWRAQLAEPFDILCYSGYRYAVLKRRHSHLLAKLDALISEPYVESLPTELAWRGSANQRLLALSALGETRYGALIEGASAVPQRFQLALDAHSIWFIGIPRRGDLDRLAQACAKRGVVFSDSSWRA